jgi:hypothetical protein
MELPKLRELSRQEGYDQHHRHHARKGLTLLYQLDH